MKIIKKNKVLVICAYTWPFAFGGGRNAMSFTQYLNTNGSHAKLICYKGTGKGIVNRSIPYTLQIAWYNSNLFLKIISLLWIAPIYFFLGVINSTIFIVGAYNVGTPFAILGAKLMQRKIIFRSSLIGEDDPLTLESNNSLNGFVARCGLAYCNIYHAINPAYSKLLRKSKYRNKRFVTVSQGINTNKFNAVNRHNNQRHNKSLSIVSAGLIIKRKGYREIFDLLSKLEFPFIYTLVTSRLFPTGFNSKQLVKESEELIDYGRRNLGEKLRIIESCENIEKVLANSDIILHNSYSEGTPNVIMEAMACGVVPVVRELPGFKDFLICDKKNGFLYSEIENAGRILSILNNDKSLMNGLSKKASEYAFANFSFEKTWQEIQKALAYV